MVTGSLWEPKPAGDKKMLISKIRRKWSQAVQGVRRASVRILSKEPKRKFFYGKYYTSCEVEQGRILIDMQNSPEDMAAAVEALALQPEVQGSEVYLAVSHGSGSEAVRRLAQGKPGIKVVERSAFRYLKLLATSKYLVFTQAVPSYFIKREGQVYLHLWTGHGENSVKSLYAQEECERNGTEDVVLLTKNFGELQHSLLMSSCLCFCNAADQQAVMDAFCLNALYTGDILSASASFVSCAGDMLGFLFTGQSGNLVREGFSENAARERKLLIPKSAGSAEDFETLKRYVQKDDVVQLTKKQWRIYVKAVWSAGCPKAFDCIVVDSFFPRSYMEEIRRKMGSRQAAAQLEARNKQRKYGGIPFSFPAVTDIWLPEVGLSVSNAKITKLQAMFEIREQALWLRLQEQEKYEIRRLLLADKRNTIVCMRDVSDRERASGEVTENFRRWAEVLSLRGRYEILGEVWDVQEQKGRLVAFSCEEIIRKKQRDNEPLSRTASYLEPIFGEGLAFLCYQNGKERLALVLCTPNRILHEQMQAKLLRMKSGGSALRVDCRLKKADGICIRDVVFRYRSVISYDIPLHYTVKEDASHFFICIDLDFSSMQLRELYWDLFILIDKYGMENEVLIKFPNQYWKCKFYLTNKEYKAGEGHVAFPYYTVADCLAFLYRSSSPYDGYATKLKDMAASCIYIFARPFLRRRHIWLVFEKFCTMAQDNGYYFFKYCMENLPKEEKKHIYYVIDKNAPEYSKVKQYGRQVLPFMGFRHCLYILGAALYVGSDAKSHLYAWRSKTSFIRSKMLNRPIFFLQHGVTALKDVSKIFGIRGSSAMTYFAATSRFEQEIIINKLHYKKENAPITGFTRWDVLEDTSTEEDKLVLMMPTWRSWLEEVSDEDFQQSDYYRNYANLLQDGTLLKILEKYGARMIFYIHPKFAGYQKNFTGVGERIKLVPFGSMPLNEIIKKCRMLITDYSSVCWDVYYQKKPVIFYQFDYEKYNVAHGSFIDLETELFGRRATDKEVLLKYAEECIASGFQMPEEDLKKHSYYFEYLDRNNSQRTYQYLKEKGY